jgi:hypothetical protein
VHRGSGNGRNGDWTANRRLLSRAALALSCWLGGCPALPLRRPPTVEGACDDRRDEDRDGLVDCDDPDCAIPCAPALSVERVSGLPPWPDDGDLHLPWGAELPIAVRIRNGGGSPQQPFDIRVSLLSADPLPIVPRTLAELRIDDVIPPGSAASTPLTWVRLEAPGRFRLAVELIATRAPSGWLSPVLVVAPRDRDEDGLSDDAEAAVAAAFAPVLVFHPEERCAERRPQWAVSPIPAGVSVFYALSYRRDCGLPLAAGAGAHLGDAEFVVVDLLRDRDLGWEVVRVFLSAHYRAGDRLGGGAVDRSAWYPPDRFAWTEDLAVPGGQHPSVVVARHKHANYPDLEACRLSADSCAHGRAERVDATDPTNLGERARPLLGEVLDGEASEWYWRGPLPFCGWNVASVMLDDRKACASARNSWHEQLLLWRDDKLETR